MAGLTPGYFYFFHWSPVHYNGKCFNCKEKIVTFQFALLFYFIILAQISFSELNFVLNFCRHYDVDNWKKFPKLNRGLNLSELHSNCMSRIHLRLWKIKSYFHCKQGTSDRSVTSCTKFADSSSLAIAVKNENLKYSSIKTFSANRLIYNTDITKKAQWYI